MKPRGPSVGSRTKWILAAVLLAVGASSGTACGNNPCENAATHQDDCLKQRMAIEPSAASSTVDCSNDVECDAVCVLDADCETIAAVANGAGSENSLVKCLTKCDHGT